MAALHVADCTPIPKARPALACRSSGPLAPLGWSCWAPSLPTPKASSGPHPTPAWWSARLSLPCSGFLGAPCYSFPQRLPLDFWLIFPPSPFLLILVSANGLRFLPKLQGPLGRLPPLILTSFPLPPHHGTLTSLHPALTLALSLFHRLLPSCRQRLFLGPLPPAHPSCGCQCGFVRTRARSDVAPCLLSDISDLCPGKHCDKGLKGRLKITQSVLAINRPQSVPAHLENHWPSGSAQQSLPSLLEAHFAQERGPDGPQRSRISCLSSIKWSICKNNSIQNYQCMAF